MGAQQRFNKDNLFKVSNCHKEMCSGRPITEFIYMTARYLLSPARKEHQPLQPANLASPTPDIHQQSATTNDTGMRYKECVSVSDLQRGYVDAKRNGSKDALGSWWLVPAR